MHNQKKANNKFKNKQKKSQNYQKVELYGTPTTKKLKKKHSLRLVGGVETGSQDGEDTQQSSSWMTGFPHVRADKPGGTTEA